MNISIPEQLKGWAESRVAEGRYSSTSDYVRDLVRRDQEREQRGAREEAVAMLRRLWAQGLDSGEPVAGNFDADDVARRGAEALEAARHRG